jgi:hypothetical protein
MATTTLPRIRVELLAKSRDWQIELPPCEVVEMGHG